MIFVSRDKGLRLIKKPVHRNTDQRGKLIGIDMPQRVQFIPMHGEPPTSWLPMRGDRKEWGAVDSRIAAEQCGISEEELVNWIKAHPRYGIEFIAVEEQKPEAKKDDWIKESGDGFYCKLCDKYLANEQGMKSHRRSKSHLAEAEAVEKRELAAIQREVTPQEVTL